MEKPRRKRLDEIVLERGWASSRSQAQALIMTGKIRTGTTRLDKPGKIYPETIEIELDEPARYVSRGAEKLAGFFKAFPLEVTGLSALDIGASTGGFTDFLLQAGVRHMTCIDVGKAQLHPRLVNDPRVLSMEGVNARFLTAEKLPQSSYRLIVMDVSFISQRRILPTLWHLLDEGGWIVTLIKPQFEAGKAEADRNKGIIRDTFTRGKIVAELRQWAINELPDFLEAGWMQSPIKGAEGNVEYVWGLRKLALH
jgi:23S rRNA (cytidine1920-2'-O)/16S rRNA (cytidine1409-2'-O)-methyltransferase